MGKSRPRPRSLENTNEFETTATSTKRGDFRQSRRFLTRLCKLLSRSDDQTTRNIAAFVLRETNGFTAEMIGLIFGRGATGGAEMVRAGRDALPKNVSRFIDHKVDTFTAIQTSDAETILDRIGRVRHLLGNDVAVDAAISNLRDALTERYED